MSLPVSYLINVTRNIGCSLLEYSVLRTLKFKRSPYSVHYNNIRSKSTYKAAVLKEHNKSLQIEEFKQVPLKKNQVRIETHACALNASDLLMCQGISRIQPNLPFVPGYEIAGEVLEVNIGDKSQKKKDEVKKRENKDDEDDDDDIFPLAVGDRVIGLNRERLGGFGEQTVIDLKVIAACNAESCTEELRSKGAWSALKYTDKKLRERVQEISGRHGADIVFETVGGDLFESAIHSVAPEGKVIIGGFASQRIPDLQMSELLTLPSFSLIGVSLRNYRETNYKIYRQIVSDVLALHEQGLINPLISKTFELREVNDALFYVKEADLIGKLVLQVKNN
ncbi:quinone oxidoreductase-like protein 2 isoform X2 [Lycorma delicatula]|uniref:quinone oxidoreductase-like protein 2 isoform X2 n=1 Tax=Lycorma delicatula TaxID=130591 RepID=UPI003F513116